MKPAHTRAVSPPIELLTFNDAVLALIRTMGGLAQREYDVAQVDRTKLRFTTLIQCEPMAPIKAAAPIFVTYAEVILAENEAARERFVTDTNIRAEAAANGIAVDDATCGLIELLRALYGAAPKATKSTILGLIKTMLRRCLEYELGRV